MCYGGCQCKRCMGPDEREGGGVTIQYKIEDYDEDEWTTLHDVNRDYRRVDWLAAQACAEDHFYNHDGWESSWPLTFTVSDGTEEKRFEVNLESRPEFDASEIEPEDEE